MSGHAIQRLVRQSPRKMRLVIDLIRGKDVNEAYAILKFNKKLAAKQIAKTLKSAVANAEQKALKDNERFDPDALVVTKAIVNGGQPLKRFTAAAQGRATPIRKRTSHVEIHVDIQGERVMGQKTHPIGLRLGIVKQSSSRWFATKDMPALLKEDELIRKYLKTRLGHAAIAQIDVERRPGKVTITVHTGRPGVVIGKRGAEVDKLRDELAQLTGKEAAINVEEIKRPELSAQLVGDNIAHQLTQRISFRRAMKRAVQSAMRMGAQGIKVRAAGRLGGAEIARTEGYHEGRVPLHTLRADIDYATSTAKTTYGTIGIKVWIFKGEVIEDVSGRTYSTGA